MEFVRIHYKTQCTFAGLKDGDSNHIEEEYKLDFSPEG